MTTKVTDKGITYPDGTKQTTAAFGSGGGEPIDAYTKAETDDKFYDKDEIDSLIEGSNGAIVGNYRNKAANSIARDPQAGNLYLVGTTDFTTQYDQVNRIYISDTDGDGNVRNFDEVKENDKVTLTSADGSGQYTIVTISDLTGYRELVVNTESATGTIPDYASLTVVLNVESKSEALVWENKTADRVVDNTYTNDNDVPLYVQLSVYSPSGDSSEYCEFLIDDEVVGSVGSVGVSNWNNPLYIIPAGSTYRAKLTGTPELAVWREAKMPLAIGTGGGSYTPEKMVWEDVTADRVLNTEYTNTNDVPLYLQFFSIISNKGTQNNHVNVYIDGKSFGLVGGNFTQGDDSDYNISLFVVPSGATYKFQETGTIQEWKLNEAKMPVAVGTGGGGTTDILPVLLSGTVFEDGIVGTGEDFTCNKTGTGKYTITFNTPRTTLDYSVTALTNTSYVRSISVANKSETKFDIWVRDSSSNDFVNGTFDLTVTGTETIAVGGASSGGGSYTPETFVWEDKLAERELNTYYTNSTGRPIEVFIIGGEIGTGGDIKFCYKPNGGSEMIGAGLYTNSVAGRQQMTFTVPDGDQYKISGAGTASLIQWWEVKMPLAVGAGDSLWTDVDGVATYDGDVNIKGGTLDLRALTTGADFSTIKSDAENGINFDVYGSTRMSIKSGGVTTSQDMTVNGITVGRGKGNKATNTVVGNNALVNNADGQYTTAFGNNALENSTANGNSAFGIDALKSVSTGSNNTGLGNYAGSSLTTGRSNVLIGENAQPSSPDVSNEVTIGNDSITSTRLKGTVTSNGTPLTTALDVDTAIDRKLAIKDKLIEKLSARLDELEKRVK